MADVEVRINMSPLQAGKMYVKNMSLEKRVGELEGEKARLLHALKWAYRKHHCGDDSIGWDELSEIMSCALPEVMGSNEFCVWLGTINNQDNLILKGSEG